MPEGFDLAPIAIGAYQPRWFRNEQHVNLVEVVQIHQDLNARRSVGSHSRTFSLTDDLLHRPPIDLSLAAGERSQAADAITVMAIGETPVPPAQATP